MRGVGVAETSTRRGQRYVTLFHDTDVAPYPPARSRIRTKRFRYQGTRIAASDNVVQMILRWLGRLQVNGKRMILGIIGMLATAWALGQVSELLSLGRHIPDAALGGLGWLIAALVGGSIARSGFVPVAVVAWLLVWGVIIYTLYQIARPVGQASLSGIVSYNAVALGISLAATCIGAQLGQRFAERRGNRSSSAT